MTGLIAFFATPAGQATLAAGFAAIGWLARHKGVGVGGSKPTTPAQPAAPDPFAGLPGLKGHPLANGLLSIWEKNQTAANQAAAAQVLAELMQLANPQQPAAPAPQVTPLGRAG